MLLTLLRRYTRWLHTGWPAGTVEKLPRVAEDGSTNVPGLYVVGDLSGIPLRAEDRGDGDPLIFAGGPAPHVGRLATGECSSRPAASEQPRAVISVRAHWIGPPVFWGSHHSQTEIP
mgnify:CR=1 FL=1